MTYPVIPEYIQQLDEVWYTHVLHTEQKTAGLGHHFSLLLKESASSWLDHYLHALLYTVDLQRAHSLRERMDLKVKRRRSPLTLLTDHIKHTLHTDSITVSSANTFFTAGCFLKAQLLYICTSTTRWMPPSERGFEHFGRIVHMNVWILCWRIYCRIN